MLRGSLIDHGRSITNGSRSVEWESVDRRPRHLASLPGIRFDDSLGVGLVLFRKSVLAVPQGRPTVLRGVV